MVNLLKREMSVKGYQIRVVSSERLPGLRAEIEALNRLGQIDPDLYGWLEGYYQFDLPTRSPEIVSLIIVASRSPRGNVYFRLNGQRISCVLPPTYLDFDRAPVLIEQTFDDILGRDNFWFQEAKNLPNKLLAVRSGLSAYGRNNITYAAGMGSFHLLTAFYSDLPCYDDDWGVVRMMDSCRNCSIYIKQCPTGAITEERFPVKTERCVTYHNEFWGKAEFPEWMDPVSHNSIVGCLRCQDACPQNRDYLDYSIDLAEFDAEETGLLIQGTAAADLPESVVAKLKTVNLLIHREYLTRNLRALLAKTGGKNNIF